jgi:hypothetical protein
MNDYLIGYFNTFKKDPLQFLKDYFTIILIIPTVLGGLWQIFELAKIDISFIRFFSISQLIQDGLIFLSYFLFISFYLLFQNKLIIKIFNFFNINKTNSNYQNELLFYKFSIPIIIFLIIFFIHLFIVKSDSLDSYIDIVEDLFIFTSLLYFRPIYKKILFKNRNNLNFKSYRILNKILLNLQKIFIPIFAIIIFIVILNNMHDNLISSLNRQTINFKVDLTIYDPKIENINLLFYNDKYIFLDVSSKNITGDHYKKIIPFDKILNKEIYIK